MKLVPARRLERLLLGWTGLAVLCVVEPALLWLLPLSLVALLGAVFLDVVLLWRSPALALSREVPERASVGCEAKIVLAIVNRGARTLSAEVFDEIPRDLESPDFPSGDPHFGSASLPADWRSELTYRVVPRLRGDRGLGTAVVMWSSPLGLLRRVGTAGRGQTLAVYPDGRRYLRPEALDPRRVLAALGVKPGRRRGEGTEFESLRDYVVGDDPRHIDWAATARRGRLVTRLYQHERNHRLVVAVDASRLMGARFEAAGRSKLDCAIDAALALVHTALVHGDRAGLVVFDSEPRAVLAPRTRRSELGLFVEQLRSVQSRLVEADYRALVRQLLSQRQQRALVVVLTDLAEVDPATLTAPLSLLARHHQVLLVALRDHAFDLLDATGGDVQTQYRRIVLDDLLREREATLTRLRRGGLHTLDLVAEDVTPRILNRYLALR